MFMSHQQNVGQNHGIKIAKVFFGFKCLTSGVNELTAVLPTSVAVGSLCSVEWGYGGWKPRHSRRNFEANLFTFRQPFCETGGLSRRKFYEDFVEM